MELNRLTSRMEHAAHTIQSLVEGASGRQARWRPKPDAWSVLDVINHLTYEDEYDFRDRIDLILHRPEDPWPSGESERGVTERSRQLALDQALAAFLTVRAESLNWLRNLEKPRWETAYEAPFGEIRAGDVLAAWAAHDLLHVRQLTELHWRYLSTEVEPYGTRYAGPW